MFKVGDKVKTVYKGETYTGTVSNKYSREIFIDWDKQIGSWKQQNFKADIAFADADKATYLDLVIVPVELKPEAPVKYIVKYDLVDRDPIETFTDEKSLMAWLKEVPNNKNIIKESITVYSVKEKLKPQFNTSVRLLGLSKKTEVKLVKRGRPRKK